MINRDKIIGIVLIVAFVVGVLWYTNRQNALLDPAPQTQTSIQAVRETIEFISDLDRIDPDKIKVISFEEVSWPDGCLGLPQADEICTQALVPGYRLIFDADGERMVFRTNKDGSSIRRDLAGD